MTNPSDETTPAGGSTPAPETGPAVVLPAAPTDTTSSTNTTASAGIAGADANTASSAETPTVANTAGAAMPQQAAGIPVTPVQVPVQAAVPPVAPAQPQYSTAPIPPAPQAPQVPPAEPRYGQYAPQPPTNGGYGAPAAQQQPGSPYPASYGTAPSNQIVTQNAPTGPTPPLPPSFGNHGAPMATPPKKKRSVSPIAALIVGAIVGGAAGGGVVWGTTNLFDGNHASSVSTTAMPANLVVNNTDSVTAVTGAVAVAQPSVVTIQSMKPASSSSNSSSSASTSGATGSGVILSSDGYIVTNNHVVTVDGETNNPTLTVILSDGKVYSASVVGLDPTYDLAVIKIDATGLAPATFADSSKLNVGSVSVAIGAPLGLANTVTDGIVSSLNRGITVQSSEAPAGSSATDGGNSGSNGDVWGFDFGQGGGGSSSTKTASYIYLNVIQTDAAINPGNSGGALVNSAGQVIGINVAIASAGSSSSSSSSSGSIGVGFAIPSNVVKRISDQLISTGKATHGFFGASVKDSTSTGSLGVSLASVTSGSAAANAGLQADDVITSFNGVRVTDSTELTALVRSLAPGTAVEVDFIRGTTAKTSTVTLGSYEDYTASQASSSGK